MTVQKKSSKARPQQASGKKASSAKAPAAKKGAAPKTSKKAAKRPRRPPRGKPLRQIMPGYWYYVLQQQPIGIGSPKEVGRLQVASRTGGATRETWYLYAEYKDTGGGPSGTAPRYPFEQPGSPDRRNDELFLNQSATALSPPTGIISNKIVAECAAPVPVGPTRGPDKK